jgi:hypothetical protein
MAYIYSLDSEEWVAPPIERVFEFFSHAGNLQQLTPPWLDFQITKLPEIMKVGALIEYALRVHALPMHWASKITEWNPPYRFVDVQLKGPFALWKHEHQFTSERGGTIIGDKVAYSLPLGFAGAAIHWAFVRRDIQNIFNYRAKRTKEVFGI